MVLVRLAGLPGSASFGMLLVWFWPVWLAWLAWLHLGCFWYGFGKAGWTDWFGFISNAFGMVLVRLAGLPGLASFWMLLVWIW